MLRRYYGKIGRLPLDQFVGHDGELVVDDETGRVYIMDGVTLGGIELVGAFPKVSENPPFNPGPGELWYDPVSGRTYIYYQSAWVDSSPSSTYTLPVASASVLGGVKVGDGLTIDGAGIVTTVYNGTIGGSGTSGQIPVFDGATTIASTDKFSFNGFSLYVDGDITATGDITGFYTSDERLKNNTSPPF
jgi:hypothetical protein